MKDIAQSIGLRNGLQVWAYIGRVFVGSVKGRRTASRLDAEQVHAAVSGQSAVSGKSRVVTTEKIKDCRDWRVKYACKNPSGSGSSRS